MLKLPFYFFRIPPFGGMTIVLFLFALLPTTDIWAIAPDPNAPATIQSVTDADKDIVETLVSLISGLAATASDLIYMNTPSSVTAMNTNAALATSNQGVQSYLINALEEPTQFNLSGYASSTDPSMIPVNQNSGYLVLDVYNALNAPINDLSRSEAILNNIKSWGRYKDIQAAYKSLMDAKSACYTDPKNTTGCETITQTEYATRAAILQSIFGDPTDSFMQSYSSKDVAYNPETLFSTMSYAPDSPSTSNLVDQNKATQAATFINQLSQLATLPDPRPPGLPEPMKKDELDHLTAQLALDPSTLEPIQALQDAYVQKVMQMVAAKNMAMDNLYMIHAKRMPQASILSQNLKDPANPQTIITSPLELESYAANRRLSPAYYAEIAGAPPTAVARETLFVLAEIRQQLFQNELMAERLLATLSVSALGAVAARTAETGNIASAINTQIKLILSGTMNAMSNAQNGGDASTFMAKGSEKTQ